MAQTMLNQNMLDSMNVPQARKENKEYLDQMGGVDALMKIVGLNADEGLSAQQVIKQREEFGTNQFPESPMKSFIQMLAEAFMDTTLLILMAAAAVSLIIGALQDPSEGWIEGCAIFIAVFLVANISAGNDYSKQLQFKALEASSAEDERCSVLRGGVVERINPKEVVVGDILFLQAGDMIPADAIILGANTVLSNESSLTGEPEDLKKTAAKDPFLLSACLITLGEDCKAIAIGIGTHSQWGKIKANLVTEAVNTPLQDKLEEMTSLIGYIGMAAAAGTFLALTIRTIISNDHILDGIIEAFIIAVTVVVVAIPEGLPLAVTISLAYSTKKMYQDQCFIRVLAACETMGNATNICSDKTGTLTQNRMTVVEGWYADKVYDQDNFKGTNITEPIKNILADHVAVNRQAYLIYKDQEGNTLHAPQIIGNKTEGALILMAKSWGEQYDYEAVRSRIFNEDRDKIFAFNSAKKRSSAVVHQADGSIMLFCKGATEWILKDCSHFLDQNGKEQPMTEEKMKFFEQHMLGMAEKALRTLALGHRRFDSASGLPAGWEENPPDREGLCLDCIVGIIDPLRPDVIDAVKVAQNAGVTVRMVTGDNIATASAIARQCGILTKDGMVVEGPKFRNMSPAEVDGILDHLQVMARSSPDDKYLIVTRLNGYAIPEDREDWEKKMKGKGVTWEQDRDRVLPGYREEWSKSRPEGGDVVGVTGDGTNDAPALKAADVGLAMGITGTKVAQGAADIVILDDNFSSIVRAISWGRCVYDNIRKFLQFQLTVNVVALAVVFVGAVAGFGEPLNAVQLLWVNLVMDTMGALALGTEAPVPALLERKPYKRSASLISRPMWRNIIVQSLFQVILLLVLVFRGADLFDVPHGVACGRFDYNHKKTQQWDVATGNQVDAGSTQSNLVDCHSYKEYCDNKGTTCYEKDHEFPNSEGGTTKTSFEDFDGFKNICLECKENSYVQGSIIFNTFIFCQVFNEYNARKIFNEVNILEGISGNWVFLAVSIVTVLMQIFLIEVGGEFVKTSPLSFSQWMITIGLGAISIPVGALMRYIPMEEDPESFFTAYHAPSAADEQEAEEKRAAAFASVHSPLSTPSK